MLGEWGRKKGGWRGEDRQRVSRRRRVWLAVLLAEFLVSLGSVGFIAELWFQQLLANDANSEILYSCFRALHDLA